MVTITRGIKLWNERGESHSLEMKVDLEDLGIKLVKGAEMETLSESIAIVDGMVLDYVSKNSTHFGLRSLEGQSGG